MKNEVVVFLAVVTGLCGSVSGRAGASRSDRAQEIESLIADLADRGILGTVTYYFLTSRACGVRVAGCHG